MSARTTAVTLGIVLAVIIGLAAGVGIGYAAWHGGSTGSGMMSDGMLRGMGSMMGSNGMMGGGSPGATAPSPEPNAEKASVSAREWSFSPSRLSLKAGEPVNVTLKNDGTTFHTFTVKGIRFDLRADAGQSLSGALTIPRPGRYTFACSVPGHEQAGMHGTITVR